MHLCNMAEIEKEEVEFPTCASLWQGNCIMWQHLIFLFIYIVQLYKEIGESCVCWAVGPALQSNSSNCLVLIPHRQLGKLHVFPFSQDHQRCVNYMMWYSFGIFQYHYSHSKKVDLNVFPSDYDYFESPV